jgi:hypothetical protein
VLAAATDPALNGIVAATHGDRYILRGLATFDLSPGQTASTSTIPILSDRGTWLNRRPPCPYRGLQMKSIVTLNDLEYMKDALRASLPDVKSSHRVEALARGLGWATNASMRAALAAAPAETASDEGAFLDYLRRHSFDAPSGTLLRAFAQAGLRRAMDLAPELSGFGYRVTRDRGETPEEAEARFLKNRAEMLGEHGVDEFIRAAEFLSKFGQRKSMNRKRSSYGQKHDAEREAGDYVANGMLIAAALALGFSAERTHAGSPNAYFNISSRQAA